MADNIPGESEHEAAARLGAPTVNGGSAGMNSAMFFTCPDCGACIVEMHFDKTNRRLHAQWHDELARYREARQR